jgi:ADP-heptose:LPS heptosyltransferase
LSASAHRSAGAGSVQLLTRNSASTGTISDRAAAAPGEPPVPGRIDAAVIVSEEELCAEDVALTPAPRRPARALHPFVFRHGRIGDMAMLTAVLRALHRRYGAPCYVVGMDPWIHEMYLGHPDVAACWHVPRKAPFAFGLAWPAMVRALRRSAPAPVYVLEHHRREVPRIRRLLSLAGVEPRRCLYIEEAPGTERLWLDCLLEFAARTPPALCAADYPPPAAARLWRPHLRVLESERHAAREWLAAQGWRGEPVVLVQPGNHRTMGRRRMRQWVDRDDKTWPLAHWAELLRGVRAALPEALIVLRGAPAETSMLEPIARAAGLARVARAACGLRRLFALCELAHSMISVDTGPAHVGAALGVPLVVLYGIQSPRVWLPRSGGCSPVLALEAHHVGAIAPQEVLEQWRTLLGERGARDCAKPQQ